MAPRITLATLRTQLFDAYKRGAPQTEIDDLLAAIAARQGGRTAAETAKAEYEEEHPLYAQADVNLLRTRSRSIRVRAAREALASDEELPIARVYDPRELSASAAAYDEYEAGWKAMRRAIGPAVRRRETPGRVRTTLEEGDIERYGKPTYAWETDPALARLYATEGVGWGLTKAQFERYTQGPSAITRATTAAQFRDILEAERKGTRYQGYGAYRTNALNYMSTVQANMPPGQKPRLTDQMGVMDALTYARLNPEGQLRESRKVPITEFDEYGNRVLKPGLVARQKQQGQYGLEETAAGWYAGSTAVQGVASSREKTAKLLEQQEVSEVGLTGALPRQVQQHTGRASTYREELTPLRTLFMRGPIGGMTGVNWYIPKEVGQMQPMTEAPLTFRVPKRITTEEEARAWIGKYLGEGTIAERGHGFGGGQHMSRWWNQEIVSSSLLAPEREGGQWKARAVVRQFAEPAGEGSLSKIQGTKGVGQPLPTGARVYERGAGQQRFRASDVQWMTEAKEPGYMAFSMWGSMLEQAVAAGARGEGAVRELGRRAGLAQGVDPRTVRYADMAPGVLQAFQAMTDQMATTVQVRNILIHESQRELLGESFVSGRKVRGMPGMLRATLQGQALAPPRALEWTEAGRRQRFEFDRTALHRMMQVYGRKMDRLPQEYATKIEDQNPALYAQLRRLSEPANEAHRAFANAAAMSQDPTLARGRTDIASGTEGAYANKLQELLLLARGEVERKGGDVNEEGTLSREFMQMASRDPLFAGRNAPQFLRFAGEQVPGRPETTVEGYMANPRNWGPMMAVGGEGEQLSMIARAMMNLTATAGSGVAGTALTEPIQKYASELQTSTEAPQFTRGAHDLFIPSEKLIGGGFPVATSLALAPNEMYDPEVGAMIDARIDALVKSGMDPKEAARHAGVEAVGLRAPYFTSGEEAAPEQARIMVGTRYATERGLDPKMSYVSNDIIQALGGDADGESAAYLLNISSGGNMRFAHVSQGKWRDEATGKEYSTQDVRKMGIARIQMGAGANLYGNPGVVNPVTGKPELESIGTGEAGRAAYGAALSAGFGKAAGASYSYEDARQMFMERQSLFGNVGPNYQTWRKLYPLARTQKEIGIADKLQTLSHEISQRPAKLPDELRAYQRLMTIGISDKRGGRTYSFDRQGRVIVNDSMLPGMAGFAEASVRGMSGLYRAGMLSAQEMAGSLLGTQSDQQAFAEQAEDLRRREARGKEVNWGKLVSSGVGMMREQEGGYAGSLWGRAMLSRMGRLARGSREPLMDATTGQPMMDARTGRPKTAYVKRTLEEQKAWLASQGVFREGDAQMALWGPRIQDAAARLVSKQGKPLTMMRDMQVAREWEGQFPALKMYGAGEGWYAGAHEIMSQYQRFPKKAMLEYLTQGKGLDPAAAQAAFEAAKSGGPQARSELKSEAMSWAQRQMVEALTYTPPRPNREQMVAELEAAQRRGAPSPAAPGTTSTGELTPAPLGARLAGVSEADKALARGQALHVEASQLGSLDETGALSGVNRAWALENMVGAVMSGKVGGWSGGSATQGRLSPTSTAADVIALKKSVGPSEFGQEMHQILQPMFMAANAFGRSDWQAEEEIKTKAGLDPKARMQVGKYSVGWRPDLFSPGNMARIQELTVAGKSVEEIRNAAITEGWNLPMLYDIKPPETQRERLGRRFQVGMYGHALAQAYGIDPRLIMGRVGSYSRGRSVADSLAEMITQKGTTRMPEVSEDELAAQVKAVAEGRLSLSDAAAFIGSTQRDLGVTAIGGKQSPGQLTAKADLILGNMGRGVMPFMAMPGGGVELTPADAGGAPPAGGPPVAPPPSPPATPPSTPSGGTPSGGTPATPGAVALAPTAGTGGHRGFTYYNYARLKGIREDIWPTLQHGLIPSIMHKRATGQPLSSQEQRYLRALGPTMKTLQQLGTEQINQIGVGGMTEENFRNFSEMQAWTMEPLNMPGAGEAANLYAEQNELGKNWWVGPPPAQEQAAYNRAEKTLRGGQSRADVDRRVKAGGAKDVILNPEAPTKLVQMERAAEDLSDQMRGMTTEMRPLRQRIRNLEAIGGDLNDEQEKQLKETRAMVKAMEKYEPTHRAYLDRPEIQQEAAALRAAAESDKGLGAKQYKRLQQLSSLIPGSYDPTRPEITASQRDLTAAGEAFQKQLIEEGAGAKARPFARKTWEDYGGWGTTANAMNQLTSGWELFRLRRMWQMTGASTFNEYIPTAAKAEMAFWQAGNVMGGYTPGLPGGVAGGLMATEAMKQWQTIQAGQLGYRAWGQTMGTGAGLKGIQAVLGPAAGIGLVAGSIGTTIAQAAGASMASAATGVGLPITGIAAALAGVYGIGNLATSYANPTATNAMEMYAESQDGGLSGFLRPKASLAALGNMWNLWRHGGEQGRRFAPLMANLAFNQQTMQGYNLYQTPLESMTPGDRSAAFLQLAKDLSGREGSIWEGSDPTRFAEVMSAQAAYENLTPKSLAELEGKGGMPLSIELAMATGKTAEQYQGLADSLLGGKPLALQLQTRLGTMAAPEAARAEKAMSQYGYLVTSGKLTGEQLMNMAAPLQGRASLFPRIGMAGALTEQIGQTASSLAGAYGVTYSGARGQQMQAELERIAGMTNLSPQQQLRKWETYTSARQYAASAERATGVDNLSDFMAAIGADKGAAYLDRLSSIRSGKLADMYGTTRGSVQGKQLEQYGMLRLGTGGIEAADQTEIAAAYAANVFKQRGGDPMAIQRAVEKYTDPASMQRVAEALLGGVAQQLGNVLGSQTEQQISQYMESMAGNEFKTSAAQMGAPYASQVIQMRGLTGQAQLGMLQQFQGYAQAGVSPAAMSIIQQQMLGAGAVSGAMNIPSFLAGNYELPMQLALSSGQMTAQQYQGSASFLGTSMSKLGYSIMAGGFGQDLQSKWLGAVQNLNNKYNLGVPMPAAGAQAPMVLGPGGGIYDYFQEAQRQQSYQMSMGTGAWARQTVTPFSATQLAWNPNLNNKQGGFEQQAMTVPGTNAPVMYGGQSFQMGAIGNLEQGRADYASWKQATGISNALAGVQAQSSMLSLIQQLENLAQSIKVFNVNTAYQREQMGIQWGQMQTQQGWAREDVAYGRQVAGLQYGWQMQDYDTQIRFATGRQKAQLMRERERAQEMYGLEEVRRGVEESRMETKFRWEEELFGRQKKHFEDTVTLQEESFALQKKHILEHMALTQKQIALSAALRAVQQEADERRQLYHLAELERAVAAGKAQKGLADQEAVAAAAVLGMTTNVEGLTKAVENFNAMMGGTGGTGAATVDVVAEADEEGTDPSKPVNQPHGAKVKTSKTATTLSQTIQGAKEILDSMAVFVASSKPAFEELFGAKGLATVGVLDMKKDLDLALKSQQVLVTAWISDMAEQGSLSKAWEALIDRIKKWLADVCPAGDSGTTGGGTDNPPPNTQRRAVGGYTPAYQPVVVGEVGPELVVPQVNSSVIPGNHVSHTVTVGNITVPITISNLPPTVSAQDVANEVTKKLYDELEGKLNEIAERQGASGPVYR